MFGGAASTEKRFSSAVFDCSLVGCFFFIFVFWVFFCVVGVFFLIILVVWWGFFLVGWFLFLFRDLNLTTERIVSAQ